MQPQIPQLDLKLIHKIIGGEGKHLSMCLSLFRKEVITLTVRQMPNCSFFLSMFLFPQKNYSSELRFLNWSGMLTACAVLPAFVNIRSALQMCYISIHNRLLSNMNFSYSIT